LIIPVVIANAAITGVLANVEDRYQCRVIWLVPLLAAMMAATWLQRRRRPAALASGANARSGSSGAPAVVGKIRLLPHRA
jgi:hypothetical protein